MDAHDWIEFAILGVAVAGGLIGIVRYVDAQVAHMLIQLTDKMSLGEYQRRHDELEKRVRAIERWQDHANGRARFYYPGEDDKEAV